MTSDHDVTGSPPLSSSSGAALRLFHPEESGVGLRAPGAGHRRRQVNTPVNMNRKQGGQDPPSPSGSDKHSLPVWPDQLVLQVFFTDDDDDEDDISDSHDSVCYIIVMTSLGLTCSSLFCSRKS